MTDKHFDAILAKNDIARELKSSQPNNSVILARLKTIEEYIGEGNQPSISEILVSKMDV